MVYRPEIDGIRTLAVLPVVIYHLRIPFYDGYFLPGGFLGVDIFFVISGFLITKIIIEEIQEQRAFSITNFYIRRARRIIPILITVIITSIILALNIMLPSEISSFMNSIIPSLGFFSNLHWYFELGNYGATWALLHPLLHTWSLAIEEQFYLVFPILIISLKPDKRPFIALIFIFILLLGSLVVAEITTDLKKTLSFYSPTSRAWELLVGAVLALGMTYFPNAVRPGPWLAWTLPKLGLVVLLVSMCVIDLDAWDHPGLATSPTVLATAAIIQCARPGETVTRVLSTAPLVFLGKLSYSIYLWHFPIFAFGRLSLVGHPGPEDKLLWVGLTLFLSVIGYYLIERPFRFQIPGRVLGLCLGTSLLAILGLVFADARHSVLSSHRANELTSLYGGPFYDNQALQAQSWSILDAKAGYEEEIGPWNALAPSLNEQRNNWFEDTSSIRMLVVGNSHAKDMFNALHFVSQRRSDVQVARFGLDSERLPEDQRALLFASPNFQMTDVIIIAPRYTDAFLEALPEFVSEVRTHGKIVVFADNTAEFDSPGRMPIFDYFMRGPGGRENLHDMNTFAFLAQRDDVAPRNEALRSLAFDLGVVYLSRNSLVCASAKQTCTLISADGRKTMYDYGHWSLEGASYFADKIIETGWLAPVFDVACKRGRYCVVNRLP